MDRKYLDENNIEWDFLSKDDDRQPRFEKEIEEFGFPSWEIWNLDATMLQLLYERLHMYRDTVPVDSITNTVEIDGKDISLGDAITKLLVMCEEALSAPAWETESSEKNQDCWRLWIILLPYMWW